MPDCNQCRAERHNDVPYIVHEADMARQERTIKRLWILLIILVLALVGSNLAWAVYENSFEDVVTTIEAEQDTEGGGNNYAVVGDINGTAENKGND